MWEPRRLTTLWASTACHRDSFTFTFLVVVVVDTFEDVFRSAVHFFRETMARDGNFVMYLSGFLANILLVDRSKGMPEVLF
jgi:hypothetical protein